MCRSGLQVWREQCKAAYTSTVVLYAIAYIIGQVADSFSPGPECHIKLTVIIPTGLHCSAVCHQMTSGSILTTRVWRFLPPAAVTCFLSIQDSGEIFVGLMQPSTPASLRSIIKWKRKGIRLEISYNAERLEFRSQLQDYLASTLCDLRALVPFFSLTLFKPKNTPNREMTVIKRNTRRIHILLLF